KPDRANRSIRPPAACQSGMIPPPLSTKNLRMTVSDRPAAARLSWKVPSGLCRLRRVGSRCHKCRAPFHVPYGPRVDLDIIGVAHLIRLKRRLAHRPGIIGDDRAEALDPVVDGSMRVPIDVHDGAGKGHDRLGNGPV